MRHESDTDEILEKNTELYHVGCMFFVPLQMLYIGGAVLEVSDAIFDVFDGIFNFSILYWRVLYPHLIG